MAQANKTHPTNVDVQQFLNALPGEQQRQDSQELIQIMSEISSQPAVMWGPSIIGFGLCHYKYESGREGDMGVLGFSPRKPKLTIYFVEGLSQHQKSLDKLGPHTTGKVCLYIKQLNDINMSVLRHMIVASYKYVMSHQNNVPRAT